MGSTPSPEYSGAGKKDIKHPLNGPKYVQIPCPFWIFSGNDGDDIGRIWLLVIKHGSWKSPRFHGGFKGKHIEQAMEAFAASHGADYQRVK